MLGLLEMQDVIDLQGKHMPLGSVLTLVSHELLCDSGCATAILLAGRWKSDLGTLIRGADYLF